MRGRPRRSSKAAILPEGPSKLVQFFVRIEPWLPWAFAGFFFAVMAYLTFEFHTIGGTGVETDFYAELYPQAKKLLAGDFSPLNYSAKGPVYSFLLAGMYLFVREFFRAGLLLNLLCAAGILVTLYFLVRRVFNSATAVITVLAVALNSMFMNYTYRAGSDMPFILLCLLSLLFLFRDEGRRDIILSAVFGLFAFLTRYNGVFMPAGAMVYYFAFTGGTAKERVQRAGIWLGVFLAAGLPWFIANWIATGSPVKNDNYMNIALEFYVLGKGMGYDNWQASLPKQFTGIGDIFLYNPAYFIGHAAANVVSHFLADMKFLLGWWTGAFVVFGMVTSAFIRPLKDRLLYFMFGLFYFLIISLVFYNMRFSLFLLAMYIPLAVWPLTIIVAPSYLRWPFRIILAAFVVITLARGTNSFLTVTKEIQNNPVFLKYMGERLGELESDKSQKLMARTPHVAYYAGLQPEMYPETPRTTAELVAYSREHGVRYILYTEAEAKMRPALREEMTHVDQPKPGLELLFYTTRGAVYRVR